jgi:hypothetical protein
MEPNAQLTAAAGTYSYALYRTSHLVATLCPLPAGDGAVMAPGGVSVTSVGLSLFAYVRFDYSSLYA